MEDGGWLLIRFSGTEPIIRVYCETTHEERVDDILDDSGNEALFGKTLGKDQERGKTTAITATNTCTRCDTWAGRQ